MSVTIMSPEKYEEVCNDGTQICIMCGQHNEDINKSCWYCGSSHISLMADAGCIRPSTNLPVSRDDGTYTVDSMILNCYSDEEERIKSFKATKAWKPGDD